MWKELHGLEGYVFSTIYFIRTNHVGRCHAGAVRTFWNWILASVKLSWMTGLSKEIVGKQSTSNVTATEAIFVLSLNV